MRRVSRSRWAGPRAELLEHRRLLASSATYLGLTDLDYAGPTASIGPGGTRNVELRLTIPVANGRPGTLNAVSIAGPDGARWGFGNPAEAPAAIVVKPEPFAPGATTQAFDLFLSPSVQAVDPTTGRVSYPTLANNSQLQLFVNYTPAGGAPTTEAAFNNPALIVMANDLAGQDLAAKLPTLPTLGFGAYNATYAGQLPSGMARITVSGMPAGSTIDTTTLGLGDVAGQSWSYGSTNGRWELGLVVSYSADRTSANIDFAPVRDESGTTMTLVFARAGDATRHVVDVAIPANSGMDVNLRDWGPVDPYSSTLTIYPTATPNMVSYVDASSQTRVVDIQTLLNANSPYHNITMAAGATGGVYTIDKRLDIRTRMILRGATPDVTLNFTFTTATQGAINLYSSHITLDRFKIRFANPTVNFTFGGWADPNGVAIISNRQDNGQVPRVDLNILNLDIRAPYVPFWPNAAFNGAITTINTIDTGPYASGVISGNTIYGGTIALQGGPWAVTDNKVLGSVAGTVTGTVLSLYGAHDVLVRGNRVSNTKADQALSPGSRTGSIDRFLAANNGSYNIVISGNTISDNVGLIPPNPGGYSLGDPRNNPEIMVFEGYGKTFEGSVSATSVSSSDAASYDRRVVAISSSQTALFAPGAGPRVLVILDGPSAGTSIPVVRTIPGSENTSYVLARPLPTGQFNFTIVPAHNYLNVSGNTIDVRRTVSTGLVLSDSTLNATVTGNTFLGDRSVLKDGHGNLLASQAIRFEVFVKYDDLAYNSYLPMQATISGNTIVDAVGGVALYTERGFAPSYGRTYGFVRLDNNTFEYSYQNESILTTQFADSYAMVINGAVVPDPTAARFLDPRSIRVDAIDNTVRWVGIDAPANFTRVNSVTVNGFELGSAARASGNPMVATVAPMQSATYGSDGYWTVRSSDGSSYRLQWGGRPGDIPVVADFDGNGRDDLAIYRTEDNQGYWYIATSFGPGGISSYDRVAWGWIGDILVPADYDGDGRVDLATYRPSDGRWFVATAWTSGVYGAVTTEFKVRWAIPEGAVPIPADYDGLGHAQLAYYAAATGTWAIATSWTTTTPWYNPLDGAVTRSYAVAWGGDGSFVPVSGDDNGDGRADLVLYSPKFDAWLIATDWRRDGTAGSPAQAGTNARPVLATYVPLPSAETVPVAMVSKSSDLPGGPAKTWRGVARTRLSGSSTFVLRP